MAPAPPRRPSLYSSAIQQVLVLQEDNDSLDNVAAPTSPIDPANSASAAATAAAATGPTASNSAANSASSLPSSATADPASRPWHDGLRHPQPASPASPPPRPDAPLYPWRIRDRLKTANGALVLCLNIGVDPPDIVKPSPCARLECWIPPNPDQPVKSLNDISTALKAQYERWQPKARYRVAPDPTVVELKRVCVSLRRAAKDERVLFHYNGHGVPRPTANGEIWVFNQNYSQYIPLNLFDLHEVLGSPALYIFDCNSAGTILHHFRKMTDQFERDWLDSQQRARPRSRPTAPPHHRFSIMLGACADGQLLPTAPHLPADLFTACLTTPIKALLRWFSRRSLVQNITPAMLERIPGTSNVRNTPLGELEYIFTAVTDTIAWNVLPRETFKRLYRQDLLLASLMRNFMLADRILRSYGCTPVSYPELPPTHRHPQWQSLDLAVENLFAQLPDMLSDMDAQMRAQHSQDDLGGSVVMRGGRPYSVIPPNFVRQDEQGQPAPPAPGQPQQEDRSRAGHHEQRSEQHPDQTQPAAASDPQPPAHQLQQSHDQDEHQLHRQSYSPQQQPHQHPSPSPSTESIANASGFSYRSPTFFEDHMKAFSVWLDMGPDFREPPEQLPIMLQVLLTPALRLKALPLISRYMQTGPVAVDLALSVGIFPYVQRLLQNQSKEIRKDLVFIWSKILALDDSCRGVLVNDDEYFVRFLRPPADPREEPKAVYLACAMFVLSAVARAKADKCHLTKIDEACFMRLSHSSPFVRRWACLCLTEIFRNAGSLAQIKAMEWKGLLDKLRDCAKNDNAPDVRAAAVSTLSAIMNGVLETVQNGGDYPPRFMPGAGSLNKAHPSAPLPPQAVPAGTPACAAVSGPPFRSNGVPSRTVDAVNLIPLDPQPPNRFDSPNGNAYSYSPPEREAMLRIGKFLSTVASSESSVLVRREVSIAIATAVQYQQERFVRAALLTDIADSEDLEANLSEPSAEECEAIQRSLWIALSELAFDPHPVAAAIARRSYDKICDILAERTSRQDHDSMTDGTGGMDHAFSPPDRVNEQDFTYGTPESTDGITTALRHASTSPNSPELAVNGQWADPGSSNKTLTHLSSPQGAGLDSPRERGSRKPPQIALIQNGRRLNPTHNHLRKGAGSGDALPQGRVVTGSIRVRSTSGSFDLNVSSRLPLRPISRTNSVTMFPSSISSSPQSGLASIRPDSEIQPERHANLPGERQGSGGVVASNSLPQVALAKGIMNIMKTLPLNFVSGGAQAAGPRPGTSNHRTNGFREKGDLDGKAASPPRPPKRSHSYQVLNAASALSQQSETPLFSPSKHTSYLPPASVFGGSHENINGLSRKLPSGYDRLFLSGAGNAALSLYEWSTAFISRVEFDAVTPDYLPEEEALPRYATLWNKLSQSKASSTIAEKLRNFALLGKGDDVVGLDFPDDDVQDETVSGTEMNQSRELSLYSMGAGGGAVSAMTFLPRDMGIGDDQLLATGDITGSVGVYDARTGKCQGAFGIPLPPGIPEEGVSSIICLNPTTEEGATYGTSMPNSHSALILAGAYDGRVAVFKSYFAGPNYRIMSTFQASGRTIWSGTSGLGTGRYASRTGRLNQSLDMDARMPPTHDVIFQPSWGEEIESDGEREEQSTADIMRKSGNGLALGFKSAQGLLGAGGCDGEIVRIWDLEYEKCKWQGPAVAAGTWPTAVSMWKTGDVNLFAVGSSSGSVNLIDMRERPLSLGSREHRIGLHSEPVISIGTCPPERGSDGREMVVSADVGGEIVFWDPRWQNGQAVQWSGDEAENEVRRIGAHQSNLTAMAVHQTGRYVASGSSNGVKIFGPGRSMLKMLSYHERGGVSNESGLNDAESGHRIAAVTSLAFQHESSMLAVGCMDSSVMIYGRDRDLFPGA